MMMTSDTTKLAAAACLDAPRDRWAPSLTHLRAGRLTRRYGLPDALARTVAGLAYGEGRA